jgi:hypothetical protein
MDAILEVPMGVVVEGLAFDAATKEELLGMKRMGQPTTLTPIYELMLAREAGEWDIVARQTKILKLSLAFVNRAYNEAVTWAHQMTSTVPPQK